MRTCTRYVYTSFKQFMFTQFFTKKCFGSKAYIPSFLRRSEISSNFGQKVAMYHILRRNYALLISRFYQNSITFTKVIKTSLACLTVGVSCSTSVCITIDSLPILLKQFRLRSCKRMKHYNWWGFNTIPIIIRQLLQLVVLILFLGSCKRQKDREYIEQVSDLMS
jgi:hypothetical protein